MDKKTKHGRYDEQKLRVNMALTPSSIDTLDERAAQMGISRSEVIEQFARGLIGDIPPEQAIVLGELSAG